jgi:glutamate N-acetyltransferase/amino-acid N-acetyltransferase
VPLPVEKIERAAAALAGAARADEEGFEAFSRAILTTDKGPKTAAAEVTIGRRRARLLGCTKGAGMIAPNMATTLAFVVTDADVEPRLLRAALREVADATFNEVSVDGDTSTNDSLFLFASGRAGNPRIGAPGRAWDQFRAALHEVLESLALQIVRDGEGATRVVTIAVEGASDVASARRVARRIATSPLVKTALFGADPNWGRILCAVGNAGVELDPERVDIHVGDVPLVRGGVAAGDGADERAHAVMKQDRYPIRVHLHRGRAAARHVTCDLTHEYVTINADYRT